MAQREIFVRVRQQGAQQVQKDIAGIGRAANRGYNHVISLRSALTGFSIGHALLTSVNTLKNFAQEMSTVKAISGATGQVFIGLREEAKKLGATTRFTATNAAEGMSFLARAGFNTTEILKSTASTLTLAQAGALNLGRAADIVSNVMIAFGASASKTTDFVDTLAFTANNANTNIDQLGQAMKYAAPVSHALGLSVKETSAAVGVLSDAGLQADMAGTGLRQFFLKLLNPTQNTIRVLTKLGLNLSDVNVASRGLLPVLQTLADKNISVADTFKLFEARGGNAALVLLDALPKLKSLGIGMKDIKGYADGVAKTMNDNLNGALLSVQSRIQDLIISLGDLGIERGLTDFFWGLADALASISANAESLIPLLYGLGAAIGYTLVRQIQRATLALYAMALANPFTALLVVIPAAISAVQAFGDQVVLVQSSNLTLKDVMNSMWEDVKIGARAASEDIKTYLSAAIEEATGRVVDFGDTWGFLDRLLSKLPGIRNLYKPAKNFINQVLDRAEIRKVQGMFRGGIFDDESGPDPKEELRKRQQELAAMSLRKTKPDADFDVDQLINKYQDRLDLFNFDPLDRQATIAFWNLENNLLEHGVELSAEKAEKLDDFLHHTVRTLQVLQSQDKIMQSIGGAERQALVDRQALNILLEAGKITLKEFSDEMLKIERVGLAQGDFFAGIKLGLIELNQMSQNFGQQVAGWLVSSFNKISNAMSAMVQEGKVSLDSLKGVLASILADFAKIMMQRAMLKAISFLPFAQGGVIGPSGPLTAYASGGVVDTPTFFQHGGGIGLMGEAGPEAILPLSRGAGGKLGVKTSGGGGNKQTTIKVTYNNHFESGNNDNIEGVVQSALQENNRHILELVREAESRRG